AGIALTGERVAAAEAEVRASAAAPAFFVSSQRKKKRPAREPSAKPAAPKPDPLARIPFTAAEQDVAIIPEIADARVWSDREQDFLNILPAGKGPWLVLSSGGSDGAFGAGLLNGWSASGKRPEFSVVTGVSTGALMAPYAFVGARYDEALQ